MPLQPRPKKRESSNLVLMIKYGGLKATQFFSKYTAEACQQLLNDLTDLGFPHPRRTNIVLISHGTLEFFWPIGLHEKSAFVTNLRKRVALQQEGPFRAEQLLLRKQLSITKLTIREEVDYDPYLENVTAPSPVGQPKMSGPRHPNNPQNQHLLPAKPAERFHPYSYIPSNSASHSRSTDANNQGHQVSQSGPRKPHERAAEMFLDAIETSLGSPALPKPEPMDPVIPSPVRTRPLDIQVKCEQLSPSLSLPPVDPNHVRTRSHVDLTDSEPLQLTARRLFSTPSAPRNQGQPSSLGTSPMSFSSSPPGTTTNGAPRYLPRQDPPPPAAPAIAPPSTPSNSHSIQSPSSAPTPKPGDKPVIRQLAQELFSLRKEVFPLISKHNKLVDELQALGGRVPPKISRPGFFNAKDETSRLQEVEKELESERLKQLEMAKELEAERTKRRDMEAVLKDVERECRSPFVVPGLLEAFIQIAEATTAAMRGSPSGSGQE